MATVPRDELSRNTEHKFFLFPAEDKEKIKKEAQDLIANGKVRQCILYLERRISHDSDIKSELISLKSRLNSEEKAFTKGLLSFEEKNLTLNKITAALLSIIESIHHLDFKYYRILNQILFPKISNLNENLTKAQEPLSIFLDGDKGLKKQFYSFYKEIESPHLNISDNNKTADYSLKLSKNLLDIWKKNKNTRIHGIKNLNEATVEYIKSKLETIEKWERIAKLNNEHTKLNSAKVEMRFLEEGQERYYDTPIINLNYLNERILFQIQARNLSSRDLYIGLIHLSPKFAIETFFSCEKFPASNMDWITLDKRHFLEIKNNKDHSVTDIFLLIVSTHPFDDRNFIEKDIEIGRIIELENAVREIKLKGDYNTIKQTNENQDWFVKKMVVDLSKVAKAYSLHIGVNMVDTTSPDYDEDWDSIVKTSETDAKAMLKIAKSLNYTESIILLTEEATRVNFFNVISNFAKKLQSSDLLLISFSGHRGQVTNIHNDAPSGFNETWCFYDGNLLDDELTEELKLFKEGVKILIISDSCHSGGMLSGISSKSNDNIENKIMESKIDKEKNELSNRDKEDIDLMFGSTGIIEIPSVLASVQLISSTQSYEYSREGKEHGIFTQALLKVWEDGNFEGNYKDFYHAIVSEMPYANNQTPNHLMSGIGYEVFSEESPFSV